MEMKSTAASWMVLAECWTERPEELRVRWPSYVVPGRAEWRIAQVARRPADEPDELAEMMACRVWRGVHDQGRLIVRIGWVKQVMVKRKRRGQWAMMVT